MPGRLAAIDGLVFEDLAGVAQYDSSMSCFVVADGAPVKPDLADIVAAELSELCGECASGSETPLLGQPSSF
jgi:hypothetical protein